MGGLGAAGLLPGHSGQDRGIGVLSMGSPWPPGLREAELHAPRLDVVSRTGSSGDSSTPLLVGGLSRSRESVSRMSGCGGWEPRQGQGL